MRADSKNNPKPVKFYLFPSNIPSVMVQRHTYFYNCILIKVSQLADFFLDPLGWCLSLTIGWQKSGYELWIISSFKLFKKIVVKLRTLTVLWKWSCADLWAKRTTYSVEIMRHLRSQIVIQFGIKMAQYPLLAILTHFVDNVIYW